jgi:hypothetical protein
MYGRGIVDNGLNPTGCEVADQGISMGCGLGPDDIKMPDMGSGRRYLGLANLRMAYAGIVLADDLGPSSIVLVEKPETGPQNSSLAFIQTTVIPLDGMVVFFGTTIIAKGPQTVSEFVIIGGDSTAITKGTKIFPGIKTEGGRMAKSATPAPPGAGFPGSLRLRTILKQEQAPSLA